jgi:hypothetical protein
MIKNKEISRTTWSSDGKYQIVAYAKFDPVIGVTTIPTARAVVHVFEGDSMAPSSSSIFASLSDLHCNDLLDELQNAERIGRDFINMMRHIS